MYKRGRCLLVDHQPPTITNMLIVAKKPTGNFFSAD